MTSSIKGYRRRYLLSCITLHDYVSIFKVLLALAEKGIPYRSRQVNLGQFENYAEWFMRINPKGQVPVLEDNDKYILDSENIIKYLDDVYGKFLKFNMFIILMCENYSDVHDGLTDRFCNYPRICEYLTLHVPKIINKLMDEDDYYLVIYYKYMIGLIM